VDDKIRAAKYQGDMREQSASWEIGTMVARLVSAPAMWIGTDPEDGAGIRTIRAGSRSPAKTGWESIVQS